MSIRQTLNEVLAGSKPPAAFLKAVDEYLAKPDANVAALRSLVDAAEQLGLPEEIANAARARLPHPDGIVGIGEPTRVAGSDDTTEIISDEATKVDIGDATAVTDDADRTELTAGDAPTHLRADPADIDRTVFTGDSDRTEISGDPDRTEMTGADTTLISGGGDATVQVGGDDPFAMSSTASKPDELGPGSVLKGRFRLEEVIGQGGMGAVYKAVDLLKVEARDRNPYMAVKLLVGDFKEHPEAFIALQRESAKAQRLAHPNIATVYDFDRDGETVYMTMELMVGVELAKYIKKLPAGGLPVPEAMRIIEQLCSGLQYAHARGLVHSDFKPGNAFLLDDGSVKLLDFGIARASKTKGDAEGESTVFDPGQLGALTPAYATIEMFEGQDPDPRDDIYALAAVSYELFTGKHPFNKMSAVKAKEKGLKPASVDKLTKRQNRVLLKALALHRDDRCPSVEEFWENLKPRKDYTLQIAGGATAAVLLLGALLYNPVMDFIHQREHNAIAMEIDSGDPARFAAALERIDSLPPARQRVVADQTQEALITHFNDLAEAAIDESVGRYDYAIALQYIDQLDRYFPDSNTVGGLRRNIEGRRGQLLSGLKERFENALTAGAVLANPDADDLTDIVPVLRAVEPENELLESVNAINAYKALADTAVTRREWQRAKTIVDTGLAHFTDPGLLDLRDSIGSELRRQEEAELIASLRTRLQQARPRTLAEFRAVNEDLQRLGTLLPNDSTVRGFDAALTKAVADAVSSEITAGNWAGAEALLVEFARVLPMEALVAQRSAVTAAAAEAGAQLATIDNAPRITAIRTLLAGDKFDELTARDLVAQFKELTARIGTDTAAWDALRTDIVAAHVRHANGLIGENRYSAARETLSQAGVFQPGAEALATATERLAAAETEYRTAQAEIARLQAIEAAKDRALSHAGAGRMDEALREFNALRGELDPNDEFLTTIAPRAFSQKFMQLAEDMADENPAAAAQFMEAGLRVVPASTEMRALLTQYQGQARRAAVENSVANLDPGETAAFRRAYASAREGLSQADATAFERDVVSAMVGRLNVLERTRQGATLRGEVVDLFSDAQQRRLTALNLREPERPSQYAGRIQTLINDRKLTEARTLLTEAQRAEPNHAQLSEFPDLLTTREREATGYLTQARQSLATGNRPQAQAQLTQAKQRWTDGADILEFERQNFQVTRGTTRADDGSKACTAQLAGYGTRAQGRCNDVVAPDVSAPQLVVVTSPSGGAPFAIGRFEVTVEDFNRFCATGGCQALSGAGNLPATGVSVQDVDRYLAWLTETTGQQYRLPTDAEWRHAAAAGGNPGSSDQFNCRVMGAGGNVVKGAALTSASAGATNGWGLINAVGNAQEWVRDGGQLRARGGAFEDSLTTCNIDLVRPHAGTADGITGFRVVRGVE